MSSAKETYDITGMTCSACAAHVQKAVAGVAGVSRCDVNLLRSRMSVEYDPAKARPAAIIKAVEAAGYGARLPGAAAMAAPAAPAGRQGRQLLASVILLVPLLYLGMGPMLGLPQPGFLSGMLVKGILELLLSLPVLIINRHYFIGGFRSLLHRAPNMDSLIAIGSGSSFIYSLAVLLIMAADLEQGSQAEALRLGRDLYFESSAMILTLISLGKYLESRSKKKTSEAISRLIALVPQTAVIERDGAELTVPTAAVRQGDIVVVKAGGTVPVDGIIISGRGSLDEAALTGESLPVDKAEGSEVTGAAILASGYIRYRATRVGEDTALSRIIRLVDEASGSKAPIARLADQISGIFVPVVMGISLITFIAWLLAGQPLDQAFTFAVSVLVISCPCALGLATPTAIMVGTGAGARSGILIRSAESLQTAGKVTAVLLDKTGTLTKGRPEVTDLVPLNGYSEEQLLALAGALEQRSDHPLAKAISARAAGLALPPLSDFTLAEGQGLIGRSAGCRILAGNRRLMEAQGIAVPELPALTQAGKIVIWAAAGDKLAGAIGIADVIKPTSPEAIRAFEKLGIRPILLSGDSQATAAAIAQKAGIREVIAEVLPQDKEKEVRKLQAAGETVAMVGDGINDAPALARADVGIAIGAGTDIAIDSADIILVRSDLLDAVNAIRLSRMTMKNIRENLFWAFFYNIIGIPIAAGALFPSLGIRLSPMIGAAAMSFSSVFVVSNALRLRLFHPIRATIKEPDKPAGENQTMKKTMIIEGMMCEHCRSRVEKALGAVPGVTAKVDLAAGKAELEIKGAVSDEALAKAVTEAGYEVREIR